MRLAWASLFALLAVAACDKETPTPAIAPEVTVEARAEATLATQAPNPSEGESSVPSPTKSPSPTPTLTPTATPTPTPTATPTPTSSATPTATPSPTPTATPTPVSLTGLLATVPEYIAIDLSAAADLVGLAYSKLQALVLLTEDNEPYLVVGLDTNIDRFITAGTVTGRRVPPLKGLPSELDFASRVIVTDDIVLMEPLRATPEQINSEPERFAFKRVLMDTTYVFAGARIKDAPKGLEHLGFGLATDKLGSGSRDDSLTVVDPYNTETQVRVAQITGTVLSLKAARLLLVQLYGLAPDDVREALDRPSVFSENPIPDVPPPLAIEDLIPGNQKLRKYHGEVVRVKGIALGGMVRTEDIPKVQDLPLQITAKGFGVVDPTGAMPIFGISSEDDSGVVFGFYHFDLSVYCPDDTACFAFLIDKEAELLDPFEEVERAGFGDRVKATFAGYTVVELPTVELGGLTLEPVDVLVPVPPNLGNPIIVTRHGDLTTGDYLGTVTVDGYMIDGAVLKLAPLFLIENGPRVIIASGDNVTFERGIPPPLPSTPLPTLPQVPSPPTATPTPSPTPTLTPTPTLSPIPTPTPTPTQVPSYSLTVTIEPSGSGTVVLVPTGGTYSAGTVVTLTAIPALLRIFTGWTGDASGIVPLIFVTVDGNKTITANFFP
ncbi:MAG: hypothetical protein O3A47_03660 [Chloroflexi bacterium]|nr:hypothetical protein [Chloroflexota bacterium]